MTKLDPKLNIPSGRIIMRIELFPEAKKGLVATCDRLGMTQIAACSRILEWFTTADETVQASVLGLYPVDIRSEVGEMIIRKMTTSRKGK